MNGKIFLEGIGWEDSLNPNYPMLKDMGDELVLTYPHGEKFVIDKETGNLINPPKQLFKDSVNKIGLIAEHDNDEFSYLQKYHDYYLDMVVSKLGLAKSFWELVGDEFRLKQITGHHILLGNLSGYDKVEIKTVKDALKNHPNLLLRGEGMLFFPCIDGFVRIIGYRREATYFNCVKEEEVSIDTVEELEQYFASWEASLPKLETIVMH